MRIVHKSSPEEYATQFWHREEKKNQNHPALTLIRQGSNPIDMIKKYEYEYKLPRPENRVVRIMLLNKEEVENLLIHEYMINDPWMRERGIKIENGCRKLKDLAVAFLEQGYFNGTWDDTQIKCYRQWKKETSLKGKIAESNKTFIEQVKADMYEIVDGWGRLLPYVALIKEGFEFHPVETFMACSE
jgi:hypothetical protein